MSRNRELRDESVLYDNGLFPNLSAQQKRNSRISRFSGTDITEEYANDATSSVKKFGKIFRQHTATTHPREHDLSKGNIFELNFDTDEEVSDGDLDLATIPGSGHRVSLDSDIVNTIAHEPYDHADGSDGRFRYLNAYENIAKKNTRASKARAIMEKMKNQDEIPLEHLKDTSSIKTSASSVFNLSDLNDYTKYVKRTELNELIRQKVHQKYPPGAGDNGDLSIMDTEDLARNFYANEEMENDGKSTQKLAKSKPKPKASWYTIDWSKKSQARNEARELSFPADSEGLSSSPSSSIHEKLPNLLQRKLKVRHLQMISFGATLGVGLFLNSGKSLTIAGGFGTLLASCICGVIVLATIVSFCEMVTFVSVVDGVSGLSSRFVDDAFGFAVGWSYFLSFAFGLAGEIVASVILLTYFPELKILTNTGSVVGFVTLFLGLILLSNLVDVRVFGEVEYFSSLIKLVGALIMIIVMIVLNRGGLGSGKVLGFTYWQYLKSDFDNNLIFGLFRPSFNLQDDGQNPLTSGITGAKGRFLSLMTAIMVVSYAYSGTEIVCIAACEAKNPRKALPSATRRVFWRILLFYCLSSFLVSLNIYSGDPRLLRYYLGNTGISSADFNSNYAIKFVGGDNCKIQSTVFAGIGSGAQSPWTIALLSVGLCRFSSIANGFFVFFAVSCGNAQLYVSSRTLYSLALQNKAPKFMTYCNRQGIPYNAVLFSASFGLLSFICVSEKATNVFQNLTSIIASSGIIVWFAMCLSFIRFYYGLKKRPDIMSRDDKSYPYKSPFQPYSAIIGLIGSTAILLGMGFVVFLKGEWDILFFFASYGSLMVFVILYLAYRFIRGTHIPSLETLDFDSGRREMDRLIWDGGREYNARSFKEVAHKVVSFLA